MATTSNTYTGNGTNKLFSITFPYLDTSDINVYLNGVLQTITTQYTFANATTVEFVTAPGAGVTVLLDRNTDDTNLEATFFPGSSIKAADLNGNFDQTLYVVQEINNKAVQNDDPLYVNKTYIDAQDATKVNKSGDSMSGNLVMGGNKVTGLGTTSNATDAATKQYVDDNALLYSGSPAFTQDGTGAVTRSWSSKLKDVVSVKDFGAVGDGVADDSVAFNQAIAAAAGKTLEVPAGTIIGIGTPLNWTTANVRVVGYGATIRQLASFPTAPTPKLIQLNAANVTIEGFKFDSNNVNTVDAIFSNYGAGSGLKLLNCSFRDFKVALWMFDASNVLVDGVSTSNLTNYHIWFQKNEDNVVAASGENIKVRNCFLDNTSADPATTTRLCLLVRGTPTYPTYQVEVTSSTFLQVDSPATASPLCCELRHCDGATFSDNYSEGGSMLVSLAGCANTVVDSNVAIRPNAYAIEVPGHDAMESSNIVISNNTISGEGICNSGIALQGAYLGKRVAITGNTIFGISDRGIYANSYWKELTITGNTISCTSGTERYGIYFQSPVGTAIITGNYFRGNGAGKKAIFILGSAPFSSAYSISGNLIDNWTEQGILLNAQDGCTINGINISNNLFANSISGSPIATIFVGTGLFGRDIQILNNTCFNNNPIVSGAHQGSRLDQANNVVDGYGINNPEGAITAGTGSIYRRRGAGYDNTLYIKNTGTGNTGWSRAITKDANGVSYVADNITKGASLITPAGTTSTCVVAFPASASWRTASVTIKATTTENGGTNPGAAEKIVNARYVNSTTTVQVTNTDIVTSAGLSLSVAYGTRNMTVTATSGASGAAIFWSVEVAAPTGQSTLTFA